MKYMRFWPRIGALRVPGRGGDLQRNEVISNYTTLWKDLKRHLTLGDPGIAIELKWLLETCHKLHGHFGRAGLPS
jgi:hypothetical protein